MTGSAKDSELREGNSIVLEVRGLGHVPAFKNSKALGKNWKTGKPTLRTKDSHKAWMERCIESFVSQLRFAHQTAGGETGTGLSLPCWIASSLPCDDSRQWIREASWRWEEAAKGEEGATMRIERIV